MGERVLIVDESGSGEKVEFVLNVLDFERYNTLGLVIDGLVDLNSVGLPLAIPQEYVKSQSLFDYTGGRPVVINDDEDGIDFSELVDAVFDDVVDGDTVVVYSGEYGCFVEFTAFNVNMTPYGSHEPSLSAMNSGMSFRFGPDSKSFIVGKRI
jgi:hypothetical protein